MSNTVLIKALRQLNSKSRKKLYFVQIIQIFLTLLDLAGIALVGVLGALAITGVESNKPGNRVSYALKLIHIDSWSFQKQVAVLGVLATLLFLVRTICSIYFTRKITHFLSQNAAKITSNLLRKLLSTSLTSVEATSSTKTLYALTDGVTGLMIGIVGNSLNIISDSFLLVVILVSLLFVDPTMAFLTFVLFGTITLVLYLRMHRKISILGTDNAKYSIGSNEKILEILSSYREVVTRNRQEFYANQIEKLRKSGAYSIAELNFMPNISKYIIETAVVFGALLISGFQFMTQSAAHAVATLSVFMAAGSRIAPSLLRLQQGFLNFKGNLGVAKTTIELIDSLKDISIDQKLLVGLVTEHLDFVPKLSLSDVSYQYPGIDSFSLKGISFQLNAGEVLAILGPSGSGKSTLVDILLGIISPQSGNIEISGESPDSATTRWPGAISYVPQSIFTTNGTIRENVSLGYPIEAASDQLVDYALLKADLLNFVNELPQGKDSYVGDKGSLLSGGQRQRLGIARAFFTKPGLLVLDEATSALDHESESVINNSIEEMRGVVTIILIAHNIQLARNADKIIYLEGGTIRAQGTFSEISEFLPNFEDKKGQEI